MMKKKTLFTIVGISIVLISVVVIVCILNVLGNKKNVIDTDKLSYGMVSYNGEYVKVDTVVAKQLADLLQDALVFEEAELEPTNGMVLLEEHIYSENKSETFTLELVFDEAQNIWVHNNEWEKKSIYGIFYSPEHAKGVINFSETEETVESGEYSMEYTGFSVDEEKMKSLIEEINKLIR